MECVLSADDLQKEYIPERDYYRSGNVRETDTESEIRVSNEEYRVYRSRWLMLFVVSSLNLSCSIMSMTFAPAADTYVAFYGITSWELNVLSMIFLFTNMTLGFVATWVLDTYGLKASIFISAWLNAIGGLLRGISTLDIVPKDHAYTVLLTGQILASIAEPFVMFAPSKLAAVWFPAHSRATANMIGNIMLPLGEIAAFVLIPLIVNDVSDIPTVLWIISVPAFFIVIVATFGVQRSRPPTPPSPSASEESVAFFKGLLQVLKNKNYIVLNLTFGAGLALFTTVTVFISQILCPRGYKDEFSGLCAALLLGLGMITAVIVNWYVEKTKRFDEVFKTMFAVSVLFGLAFTQVSRLRDQHVWVGLMLALGGGSALSIFSVGFELAVEVTYPVAAATGPGLCLVGGEIQGLVYMSFMQYLTRPLPEQEMHLETGCYVPEQVTPGMDVFEPRDWTYSNLIVFNGVATAAFVSLVLFFKPTYKRLEAEKKIIDSKKKAMDANIPAECSTHL